MMSIQQNKVRLIKKIHALKRAVGLSEEEYRLTLLGNFNVDSSKHLTQSQAEGLIAALEAEAIQKGVWQKYEGKSRFENLANRSGMASPAQLRKIEALWKDASNVQDGKQRAKALRTFLDGHFKVSDLRFLEADKVRKIIHALNQMVAQKRRKSEGLSGTAPRRRNEAAFKEAQGRIEGLSSGQGETMHSEAKRGAPRPEVLP